MPRRPIRINPFPAQRKSPLWLRIILAPIELVAAIIVVPIALAVVLLVLVLLPVYLLCSSIRDRIFGAEDPEVSEPPSYWPSLERTIPSELFGELHVTASGQAWLKATFPAFARFGGHYVELADWVYPDLPPPGEVSVVLGQEDVAAAQADTAEYRSLYDWLGRHQISIAEEIQQQLPDEGWFAEWGDGAEEVPVADRFRISSVELLCGNNVPGYEQLVTLWVDQTWDPEHAWRAEISGIRDDGFDDLDFGSM